MSLSARRAWIEIALVETALRAVCVALRKESVDRNLPIIFSTVSVISSLSARRAWIEISAWGRHGTASEVALRKESVDRNISREMSLMRPYVALRKESVDRNPMRVNAACVAGSLSARRAWIEIFAVISLIYQQAKSLSARRAWIEMPKIHPGTSTDHRRSPQGERG